MKKSLFLWILDERKKHFCLVVEYIDFCLDLEKSRQKIISDQMIEFPLP